MSTAKKPRASRAKRNDAAAAANYLRPHTKAVLDKLAALAAAGDGKSMQLFLAHTVGLPRAASETLSLPAFATAPTLQAKANVIAEAVSTGAISVEAADKLGRFLDTVARTAALEELGERVKRLEGTQTQRTIEAPTSDPAQLVADLRRFEEASCIA